MHVTRLRDSNYTTNRKSIEGSAMSANKMTQLIERDEYRFPSTRRYDEK